MNIGMWVDLEGGYQRSSEDEYLEIEKNINELFPEHKDKINFERSIPPFQAMEKSFDVYVFDWGGAAAGHTGLKDSFYESLHLLIQEKPGMLIVIWTAWSGEEYKAFITRDLNERSAAIPNNVIIGITGIETSKKARSWFGLKGDISNIDKFN